MVQPYGAPVRLRAAQSLPGPVEAAEEELTLWGVQGCGGLKEGDSQHCSLETPPWRKLRGPRTSDIRVCSLLPFGTCVDGAGHSWSNGSRVLPTQALTFPYSPFPN